MIWTIEAKDDYGYGYAAGRSRERMYRVVLRLTATALRRTGAEPGMVADRARRHMDILKSNYPACLDRVDGLSRALGMDRREVIAGSLALSSLLKTGCTNFAAVPPATADDRIYVSWNNDLSPLFRLVLGSMPLYIRDVQGSKPYVCFGLPVLFGIGMMNGDGLCAAANSVGMMDAGEGLISFELNNLAMETQSRVEGVVEVWSDNPRQIMPGLATGTYLNANNIFADMDGDAVVIEHSHQHMAVERIEDHGGVLASANHHQFLDRTLSGGGDPIIEPLLAGSFARLDRMWELLDIFRGSIEPRVAKLIVSDHGLNYRSLVPLGMDRKEYEERVDDATICCHPWNVIRHLRRLELLDAFLELNVANTIFSALMDPMRCTIWFAAGKPCRSQYVPIWLGDALHMERAGRAREEIDYQPALALKAYEEKKGPLRRPNPTEQSERGRSIGMAIVGALDRLLSSGMVEK